MGETPTTVEGVIKAGAEYLAARKIEDARLACELLVSRLLRCKRLELSRHRDAVLEPKHLEAMRRGLQRAAKGEPIQYILGQWDFLGHVFKTDRRALIPRPETEQLVEHVLQCAPLWGRPRPALVDVGTGSGCIAISLALARPAAAYLAIDPSAEALELARENAGRLGAGDKVAFVQGELSDCVEPGTCDALVSNPPYIAAAEFDSLPAAVRDFEPRAALDGGPGGLAVIEAILQDAVVVLKPEGFLFLEIGETQGARVASLMRAAGLADGRILRDLAGKDRFALARMPAEG